MAEDRPGQVSGVSTREYIEALLAESKRQHDRAEVERERAAQARVKAAVVGGERLDRQIQEGDERLREHIASQVQQIELALTSAEKLGLERMEAGKAATEGVRRELLLITQAAKEAVAKAEQAQREVNKKSNEFRGQLSDQAANLYPRREAEARSGELDRRISLVEGGFHDLLPRTQYEERHAALEDRVGRVELHQEASRGEKTGTNTVTNLLIAGTGLFIAMVAVLANVLTTHP